MCKHIPIHEIVNSLGPHKALALPMFHALTGCDTTSAFGYHGKKSAWDAWRVCPSMTPVLLTLSRQPVEISEDSFDQVQKIVIAMYKRKCPLVKKNDARRQLFTSGTQQLSRLPPTEGALKEHVKRAALRGSYVWGQCLKANAK